MGSPVATSTDLETFLGMDPGTINAVRATQLLLFAQNECETIVNPLPLTAQGVVVRVAARAYENPVAAQQVGLGSAQVSFTSGNIFLSKGDKAALRRLAGRGAAFQADTIPQGVNAAQTITVTATAGTFTLTFSGATTTALAYNATAAQVQAALEALGSIGVGNVAVTGSYLVTFQGTLATAPMPAIVANGGSLTGTISVAQTTTGVYGPGQNLPAWDFDYYGNARTLGSQAYGYGYGY